MRNPLLDKEFLKELDKTPLKEIFAEIYALNADDEVLESIEGRITGGTINIDGASSVRRTCSLTLVADELNIHEYYWGLHTKFKLAIGVKNDIDPKYPDIIWFKQGIFVISSFTTSQALSNYTISIQGKDKMSKLNGEMGGVITSLTHDFGKVLEIASDGSYTEEDLKLKDIITAAVHQFANEPMYNIVVNDLEDQGLELLEYRGKDPFYLLINESTGEPFNIDFNGSDKSYTNAYTGEKISLDSIPANQYNPLFDLESTGNIDNYLRIKDDKGTIYSVAKVEYGQTAGYRMTPLVYAGDLILNAGEPVTAMLDKIITMLGQYEYFYDIDGRFIFQKKKTYFNSSWNNIVSNVDEQYVEPSAYTSAISYSFEDGTAISSYQNNPNFANIRNDFSVWGTKKSVTGQELPVHMRYAIDIKPDLFVNYEGIHYTTLNKSDVEKMVEEWYADKNPPFYIKTKNPNGLSEDWWDIFDWAEYYKKCMGTYPDEAMNKYLRQGGVQFKPGELEKIFPRGSETTDTYKTKPVYIFDVEADGTIGYTGHGTGCNHNYSSYFISKLAAKGATAYIYKPDLPINLSGFEVPQLTIKDNLDWREIIYQMAEDYNDHHLDEDYYVKMAENNYGNYMNGKTGYEQYYVDMDAFWRELYDPEYEYSFDQVFISKTTYDGNKDIYYYTKDNYVQCKEEEEFQSSRAYYTIAYDEDYKQYMKLEIGLSHLVFKENPTLYYYIDPKEPFIHQHVYITEPYHGEGKGYYTFTNNKYVSVNKVTKATYEANPKTYYQVKNREHVACTKIKPYSSSTAYHEFKDGEYVLCDPQPKEDEYKAHPGKYYYKQYTYTQCTVDSVFNKDTEYYKETTAHRTDELIYAKVTVITEEIFNKYKPQYYTRNPGQEIVNCVTLLQEEYLAGNYYTRVFNEENEEWEFVLEESVTNNTSYLNKCAYGNLYYHQTYYECCQRYLDFEPAFHYYIKITDEYDEKHWKKDILISPESLTFWFDFLDGDHELQKYGCHSIGNRPKAVNDNQVKAIYFRETPTVIFIDSDNWQTADRSKLGYTYLNLPTSMAGLFSISSQGKSAKTVVDDFIYKHACGADSITISVLPIFHLEPNTRIFVRNDESGINGEYILVRYSLNLGSSGVMSINASKAVDRLY